MFVQVPKTPLFNVAETVYEERSLSIPQSSHPVCRDDDILTWSLGNEVNLLFNASFEDSLSTASVAGIESTSLRLSSMWDVWIILGGSYLNFVKVCAASN
jgi:hypothetical protein